MTKGDQTNGLHVHSTAIIYEDSHEGIAVTADICDESRSTTVTINDGVNEIMLPLQHAGYIGTAIANYQKSREAGDA